MPSAWDQIVNAMNWGGVGEGMPEHYGREKLMDPMAAGLTGLTSLPERAFGASEQMRQGGPYDPGPAVEAAMLPMGTGGIMGVPVKGAEAALGAGILRKQPPLIGGYHGTIAPEKFTKFEPSPVDFGTHFDRDPATSFQYAMGDKWPTDAMLTEGARTYPVVGDIKKPLPYPTDPVNWRSPQSVIEGLEYGIHDFGFKAPKGILEDMVSAHKSPGGWEKNFIPMLKDRKFDAVNYPSWSPDGYTRSLPNAYMALDANQVMPRFSPEAQELIKDRGVKEPLKRLRLDKYEVNEWNKQPEAERWTLPPSGPKPSSLLSLQEDHAVGVLKPNPHPIERELDQLERSWKNKDILLPEYNEKHRDIMERWKTEGWPATGKVAPDPWASQPIKVTDDAKKELNQLYQKFKNKEMSEADWEKQHLAILMKLK